MRYEVIVKLHKLLETAGYPSILGSDIDFAIGRPVITSDDFYLSITELSAMGVSYPAKYYDFNKLDEYGLLSIITRALRGWVISYDSLLRVYHCLLMKGIYCSIVASDVDFSRLEGRGVKRLDLLTFSAGSLNLIYKDGEYVVQLDSYKTLCTYTYTLKDNSLYLDGVSVLDVYSIHGFVDEIMKVLDI